MPPKNSATTHFLDSRDKYLSFVHATNEKVKIAFYLAKFITHLNPTRPFYVLDAGAGEGTVVSTFLAALHKQMRNIPIVVTGKEISIDDVDILLSYLPDRFAEHPALVFHITNMLYREIAEPENAEFVHITRELTGDTSHDFGIQLMTMQAFVKENWALDIKDGKLTPRRKIVLTLYRKDQKVMLANALPENHLPPSRFDFIIASQSFRLRRLPSEVAKHVVMPLLNMMRPGARTVLIYSSGRDFTRPLLKLLQPKLSPYYHAPPQKLLRALAAIPDFISQKFTTEIDSLRYDFINMYIGRREFSMGNIFSLWKTVTYVGQINEAEEKVAPLNQQREKILRETIPRMKNTTFVNNVIHFVRPPAKSTRRAKKWYSPTFYTTHNNNIKCRRLLSASPIRRFIFPHPQKIRRRYDN